jgi:NAD(P)-dependent dehydrogenase (short-subunit alcohol dehydrogenase family)
MHRILITGGAGLVGLNTARTFAAAGVAVVITARHGHDRNTASSTGHGSNP